jgi:hypothetical protein
MSTLPLGMTTKVLEASLPGVGPAKLRLVLIEPNSASFPDRRFLLSNERDQVTSALNTRELVLLGGEASFSIALISDTLGSVEFVAATRSVRKQWPTARILILGRAAVVLEDYLYDEALPQSCDQQELCDALDRMSGQRSYGGPFIVTTPASERDSPQRRQVSCADDSRMSDVPQRMTQTRPRT